jgi:hypothetical protein
MGGDKLITYTGSAHTSKEYLDLFKKALPDKFNMSPGKAILNSVRAADRRGLVLIVNMANEVLFGFEEQAYREKLREFPDVASFDTWLTVFKSDWPAPVLINQGNHDLQTCRRRLLGICSSVFRTSFRPGREDCMVGSKGVRHDP